MKEKKSVLNRLLGFIRPQGFWLVIRLFGAVVSAAVDIGMAYIIIHLVNGALTGDRAAVFQNLFIMIGIVITGLLFTGMNRYAAGRLSSYTVQDIRNQVIGHIVKLPVSYLENTNSGKIVSSLTNDINPLSSYLENQFPNILFQSIRFLGAFVLGFLISWKLLLCSMVLVPATLAAAAWISKPVRKIMEEMQQGMAAVNAVAQDSLGGIHMIKSYNLQEKIYQKYKQALDKVLHKALALEKKGALLAPVYTLMNIVPLVACVFYGGFLSIEKQITVGGLTAFIQVLTYLTQPAGMFVMFISTTRMVMGASSHLFDIFNTESEPSGRQTAEAGRQTAQHEFLLELENVSFAYDNNSLSKLFNRLDLAIPVGKITALVGSSGSGKSTLLKLLCSFYQPDEGRIKLYGTDLQNWQLSDARTQISLVSQDPYLFSATVAENIGYGKPGAAFEEIVNAAKTAHAHDFIMALPQGYHTLAGERGSRFSGGEKQRLVIARAILKNAPILLLDEATSALDIESEAMVQAALAILMKNRTVLVIAHRLSTIKSADQILVLHQGTIAENGTHDQLFKKKGIYHQLFLKQFAV